MAAVSTIIAGIGLGVAAAGAVGNYVTSKENAERQNAYQNQALGEQQRQDQIREQQMNLEAQRRQRSTLRQALQARAVARATAVAQGAQFGSVLSGAYGGIEGSAGRNNLAVRQNQELGGQMFDSNERLSSIYRSAAASSAEAQSSAAIFSGMTSLGGAALSNSQTIGKIGTWGAGQLSFGSSSGPTYYEPTEL